MSNIDSLFHLTNPNLCTRIPASYPRLLLALSPVPSPVCSPLALARFRRMPGLPSSPSCLHAFAAHRRIIRRAPRTVAAASHRLPEMLHAVSTDALQDQRDIGEPRFGYVPFWCSAQSAILIRTDQATVCFTVFDISTNYSVKL